MTREFFISVSGGGVDYSSRWGPRLISVEITDEKGVESDKVSIEVDDVDGDLAFPEPGKVLTIQGGWTDGGGTVGGDYEVDQVDLDGWPQKITVSATPVSAKKDTKDRKTEAYKKEDTKTLGDVVKKVAKRNGWTPKIDEALAKLPIKYEAQTEEFDTQFLVRLAKKNGGQVSVKKGNLVMTKPGSGKSASGQSMTPMYVSVGINLLDYHVSYKERVDHKKAQARTFDRKDVKKVDVDAGAGSIKYILKQPFADKDEAERAAKSKLSEVKRAKGSATFTIEGEPLAAAERPVVVSGIRPRVDGMWITTRAIHKFGDTYETTVECEVPGEEDEDGGDE